MSKFLKNSHLKISIFFIGILTLTNCSKELNMKLEEMTESSIIAPNGTKIVYSPIDTLLVIEFSEGVSKERKQEIIDDFNLKLLSIRHRKNLPIQSIGESTLVLDVTKGTSLTIRYQIIQKYPNDINGILPAFAYEGSKEPLYLKATTFGIVFFLDVPQDSVMGFLKRHNLSISGNWIEKNFYSYYVMRFVHVNIPKHADLFDVIDSLSKETEIYSAFPLYVNGGYALPHGPNPIPSKFTNIRKAPPYLNKIEGNLQQIYWIWKTAPMSVLKELSNRSHIPMIQDSIKVNIKLDKINLYEVHQLLIESRVRFLGSINDAGNFWAFSGIVRWQDIESFVANKKVQKVNISGEATIEGEPDFDKIPPPPN